MNKKKSSPVTEVREHPRQVPPSRTNPDGITIVDRHLRRVKGSFLDPEEIEKILRSYDLNGLKFPTANRLGEFKNADKYDRIIAVWTDYFNKRFNANPPLDPDLVKALIASESGFRLDPSENKKAFGIAQITRETFKILQDPIGEAKDLIFRKVIQRDLKDPNTAIAMATRWLFRKMETASNRQGRQPNAEELILEYKGLLKSKSEYRDSALGKFRDAYAKLKKN